MLVVSVWGVTGTSDSASLRAKVVAVTGSGRAREFETKTIMLARR
jgi:hypothetical protein